MEKTKKQQTMKILSITANVLVWVFVAFALLTTILVLTAQNDEDGVPALFGKSMVTIESDSMDPTFKKGDLIFIEKLSGKDASIDRVKALEKGDIITFWAPIDINGDGALNDINTHRIEEKLATGFRTKGDNNSQADTYTINYTDVIGLADADSRVGGVGAAIGFLRSSLGFFLCVVLPLILFFLYELYRFIMLLVTEKAKRASTSVSAEQEEEIKRRAIEEYLKAQQSEQAPVEAQQSEQAPVEAQQSEQAPAEENKEGE